MKQFTKTERESATISFTLNYKPRGMKEVITAPVSVRINELSDTEFKVILSVRESRRAYKSRKLKTQLAKINKQSNGRKQKTSSRH